MIKYLIAFLYVFSAYGDYPPTTTKGSGDSNPVVTFGITSASIPITHSGTQATIGTIPVAAGGTGLTTLTANNVILGNGTSTVQLVAPSTNGNVLTSNGTTWQSSVPGTAAKSEVTVDSGNGHGSTNTAIRRFSNIRLNTGSDITYADSAANGGSFTINSNGIYAISYVDLRTGAAGAFGVSVNTSAPTSGINGPLTYAQGARIWATASAANFNVAVSWTGYLASGDVVRAHTDGAVNATNATCMFTITKVSNLQ